MIIKSDEKSIEIVIFNRNINIFLNHFGKKPSEISNELDFFEGFIFILHQHTYDTILDLQL